MQWSAAVSHIFGGENRGKALQLLSGLAGLAGVAYGLQVLMVERSQIAVCSAEVLTAVGEQSFLRQQTLTVEVAGAVVRPGVWQLPVGSRMAAAIEKAGGFSSRADRQFAVLGLNMAEQLSDAQKIYVPFEGEGEVESSRSIESVPGSGISINSATEKELQELPGIGEARAAKIIENRPYTTLNELVSKGALTETLFTNIQPQIQL